MKKVLNLIRKVKRFSYKIARQLNQKFSYKWGYPTDLLIAQQITGTSLDRMDIILYCLAIDHYNKKIDWGFELYEKMTKNSPEHSKQHDAFMKRLSGNSKKISSLIPKIKTDSDFKIIEAPYLVSFALSLNLEKVSIKRTRKKQSQPYDVAWLKKIGFEEEKIKKILGKKEELFLLWGIYFTAAIWPPAYKYFDQIEKEINEINDVLYTEDWLFENNLSDVVNKIYHPSVDPKPAFAINKKISGFIPYEPNVRFLLIKVLDPGATKLSPKNRFIPIDVTRIKQEIRQKYKEKIPNYYFDLIIHISDTFEQNRHVLKIFKTSPSFLKYQKRTE